ncbi:MAG: ribonuclease R [Gammaproteobacteria bacterium RIFCSPHIGHO2_12_FULL_42_13]|nr:MAG: ribonuclease R [Gammaproteobacteria bacterium RIFCSPHIGHO2_12_FULL_42_13]
MSKKSKRKKPHSHSQRRADPYRRREAQLYQHPIPSREFILQYLRERRASANMPQLISALKIKNEPERIGLERRLSAMLRDGQLTINKHGAYTVISRESLIEGYVQAHRDGFGWLIPEAGGPDIFLPARQMRQVFNDDRVLVRVITRVGRRPEGAVIEVIERNTEYVAGRFFQEGGIAFVAPDSKTILHDILIPKGAENGAKSGQFVVAKIVAQPSTRRQPLGEITEVLGDQLTPGMEVELAIRAHNLPYQFPSKVMLEASKLPSEVLTKDLKNRRDLRDLPFVTIDGEDAKDFDDAVYCAPLSEGGWKVFVAIADVAHYVKPNTALDKEAQLRGNSVYFPGRVIPMLPEKLSNELCSLRPNCDRLVMVCEMALGVNGEVLHTRFDNAVIHSRGRLTYTQVAHILEGGEDNKIQFLVSHLRHLQHVFNKLLLRRKMRGAIEFETTETQIIFNTQGKIDRIIPRSRNVAHRIIEEMMLLANEMTSKYLAKSDLPLLYRIHDLPDAEKLTNLREFLKAFALRLSGGDQPKPEDFAKLLERISKRKDAQLIQTVMLRSLKQAVYSTDNRGHFGLSYDSYCHFTSPIRRYPDLMVHRALKYVLSQSKRGFDYESAEIESMGEHCSMTERRADRASRDATDWLKCYYLQEKVGKTFDGVIADVTGFGLFVELKDIYVQGLVHITALQGDYFQHDAIHHCLRGRASGRLYRLGDPIHVQIARVDLDQRKIDFVLGY